MKCRCYRYEEKGSMTVEAALAFSVFFFLLFSWILLLPVLRFESRTRHALQQTALAFSDYSSAAFALSGAVEADAVWKEHVSGKALLPFTGMARLGESFFEQSTVEALFSDFYTENAAMTWIKMHDKTWRVDLDTDEGMVTLHLQYEMELPGLLHIFPRQHVEQTAMTGIWFVPGRRGEISENRRMDETSVWKLSPWERGRIFASQWREQSGVAFAPGRGFDRYSGGVLEEVVSLNPFSKGYAEGKGEKAENYTIREEAVFHALQKQTAKIRRDYEKNETLKLVDGSEIPRPEGAPLRLIVIVPEEAERFQGQFTNLGARLSEQTDVELRFLYREQAFPKGEK